MKRYVWLILIIIIFLAFFFAVRYFYTNLVYRKLDLQKAIRTLKKEFIPLRLKIISQEDNKINFIIKFYNFDDETVGIYKDSIEGKVLFVDFIIVKIKDVYLFFPDKIYTDTIAPIFGENLKRYYASENFPRIYSGKNIDENFYKFIKFAWERLNGIITRENSNYRIFGNALHKPVEINNLIPEKIYVYVCHTLKGGIELRYK